MSTPSEVAALVTATNNLTQTVIDTRSEITSTVAAKIAELDAWKAAFDQADAKAEPRYHSVIDLTGLSVDRLYPVWWMSAPDGAGLHKIAIARNYYDDESLEPFGPGVRHIAGLTLVMEGVGYGWAGSANFLRVKYMTQRYHRTVRCIAFSMKCASVGAVPGHPLAPWATGINCPQYSGLYLRGGLTYQFFSNQTPLVNYSRATGAVEVWSGVQDDGSGRWMAKSYHKDDDPFLGGDYNDFTTPYNAFPYSV